MFVDEIEKRMRVFLWKGSSEGKYQAKVAWMDICVPKEEGGLGLKGVQDWNTVCLAQHLWDVASKKDTMWVRWIHQVRLVNCSIWNYKKKQGDPWYWKRLLTVRGELFKEIEVVVGNGELTSFWNDPWSPIGSVWEYLNEDERSSIAAPKEISVKEAKELAAPGIRRQTERVLEVLEHLRKVEFNDKEDQWSWKDTAGGYSLKLMWQKIRHRRQEQDWCKLLWTRKGIPRQDFIVWLLFRGKLNTRDRIKQWGMETGEECFLCQGKETREHLFFACEFSGCLFERITSRLGMKAEAQSWEEMQTWWCDHLKGGSFKKQFSRLCIGSLCYFIWQERNRRYHGELARDEDQLFKVMVRSIQERARSWRKVKRSKANWMWSVEWGLGNEFFHAR